MLEPTILAKAISLTLRVKAETDKNSSGKDVLKAITTAPPNQEKRGQFEAPFQNISLPLIKRNKLIGQNIRVQSITEL